MNYTREQERELEKLVNDHSYHEVAEIYHFRHPDQPKPSPARLVRLWKKNSSSYGAVAPEKIGLWSLKKLSADKEYALAKAMKVHPIPSAREMSAVTGIPRPILRTNLRSMCYTFQWRQTTLNRIRNDAPPRRMVFCQEVLNAMNNDKNFTKSICFSDEAVFTLRGKVSTDYYNNLDYEHPKNFPFQEITTWVGLLNDKIVGPFFINGPMNGARYTKLLEEFIVPAIAKTRKTDVMYQHDNSLTHNYMQVRKLLDTVYPESWIGYKGHIEWPPKSADLSPVEFCIWPYLQGCVFDGTRFKDVETLKKRIITELRNISVLRLRRARLEFESRLRLCMEEEGRQPV